MVQWRFVWCGLWAATATSAWAERAPLALSLEQALERALRASAEVVVAGHGVEEARMTRVGADIFLPSNPRLAFEARPLFGSPSGLGYAGNVEVWMEVFGAPGARIAEAERRAAAARAELSSVELRAELRAYRAYLDALVAQARIEAAQHALAIAERVLHASERRVRLGAAGESEELQARLERGQRRADLEGARRERLERLMELRQALELPPAVPLTLTTPLAEPPPAAPLSALLLRAVQQRPELQVVRTRLELLDATDRRLTREARPRVGFYAGVDAAPHSPVFGQLGVMVELAFAQRNQRPLALVAAARRRERDRLELVLRRIEREVVAARGAYEARRVELRRIQDEALPAAERNLALVEAGWAAGRFDLFRVTHAARDLQRMRALRLEGLAAAARARVALGAAAGEVPR